MNELRFVRRDERSLILANANDEEFRFVIDDLLLSELKHAGRKEREVGRVRPREIQSLVRAGKTRAEIAELTGLEEADIERYEGPVLAELKYILDRAHAIPVRTEASESEDEQFGSVIAERLLVLNAEASDWSTWRDEETGWMVCLEFISRDVAHRALWSFDHRKQTLAPISSDAVSLSKQGEVGDRLIPKLRAVDNGDRTSQFAPTMPEGTTGITTSAEEPATEAPATATESHEAKPVAAQTTPLHAAGASPDATASDTTSQATSGTTSAAASVTETKAPTEEPARVIKPAAPLDANAEYARRREIDQRAIKSNDAGPEDLSQTADLLDALRRRRGERKLAEAQDALAAEAALKPRDVESLDTVPVTTPPVTTPPAAPARATVPVTAEDAAPTRAVNKSRSIWGGAGVSADVTVSTPRATPASPAVPAVPIATVTQLSPAVEISAEAAANVTTPNKSVTIPDPAPGAAAAPSPGAAPDAPATDTRAARKGRASIPSWDDILFGTRSDEDPAS